MFVEKDDESELVARYGITLYPAFVWTDGTGAEVLRTVQPLDADELLEDLESALEELAAASSSE